MKVTISVHQIPCPGKSNPLGEDAYYISPRGDCIGVFDGVGGWSREYGVDARAYSQKLAEGARVAFEEKSIRDPIKICQFAWEGAKEISGTSTACVVVFESTGHMKAGNIGDSGALLLRQGKSAFRTREQQVEFNMPYQIGTGSDLTPDTHGDLDKVALAEGDWIIVASDGLFDNLENDEIIKVLKKAPPDDAARLLSEKTFKLSQDKSKSSPFAKDAKKHGLKWAGGKPDDITVIVGFVASMGPPSGSTSAPQPSPPTGAASGSGPSSPTNSGSTKPGKKKKKETKE